MDFSALLTAKVFAPLRKGLAGLRWLTGSRMVMHRLEEVNEDLINRADNTANLADAKFAQLDGRYNELDAKLGQAQSDVDRVVAHLEQLMGRLAQANENQEKQLRVINDMTALLARRRAINVPIKVLFLVHNPEAWLALNSVYQAMVQASDFDPIVASIPRRYPGDVDFRDEEHVHSCLTSYGVPHLRFAEADEYSELQIIRRLDPHIIFRQSQWELDIDPRFRLPELAGYRLCLVPYEMVNIIESVTDHKGRTQVYDSDFHRNAWLVCSLSQLNSDLISQSINTGYLAQYRLTGHPKADALRQMPKDVDEADKPFTVLWSAHHSCGEEWTRFGTFHVYYQKMIDLAKRHPDWHFIFSPHPALVVRMRNAIDLLTPELVQEFETQWAELPNTETFYGGDYSEKFARSNVLVSDGISWLLEYQAQNKPLIYLERAGHRPFNAIGKVAEAGMLHCPDFETATDWLEKFAAGEPDPLVEEHAKVVEQCFGPVGAADNILAAIREKIAADNAVNQG